MANGTVYNVVPGHPRYDSYAEPSKPVASKPSNEAQNSVIIDAGVLIPVDASF